ncbi:DUF732 domain-containing protein [Nocardia sp. NPDC059240]|uniref:DUF732 domain-containing protein n=1 Tax=Nocardia sp. NPDC059240 TaxID=3346786 RepID=UPI0036B31255
MAPLLPLLAMLVVVSGCSAVGDQPAVLSAWTVPVSATVPTHPATPASEPGHRIFRAEDNPTAANNFVAALKHAGDPHVLQDEATAIQIGGQICTDLDAGNSADQVVAQWEPPLTTEWASKYVFLAVGNLCQDNATKLPSF